MGHDGEVSDLVYWGHTGLSQAHRKRPRGTRSRSHSGFDYSTPGHADKAPGRPARNPTRRLLWKRAEAAVSQAAPSRADHRKGNPFRVALPAEGDARRDAHGLVAGGSKANGNGVTGSVAPNPLGKGSWHVRQVRTACTWRREPTRIKVQTHLVATVQLLKRDRTAQQREIGARGDREGLECIGRLVRPPDSARGPPRAPQPGRRAAPWEWTARRYCRAPAPASTNPATRGVASVMLTRHRLWSHRTVAPSASAGKRTGR